MRFTLIYAPTRQQKSISESMAWYQTDNGAAFVDVTYQPTNYGRKAFLICPVCGKRRAKLYMINGKVYCRDHLTNLYAGIQKTTKGGYDRISYTLRKMANRYNISLPKSALSFHPEDYLLYDQRPRYMRKRQFTAIIGKLAVLYDLFFAVWATVPCTPSIVGQIERAEESDLRSVPMFDAVMRLGQAVYGKDWGYLPPKEYAIPMRGPHQGRQA